MVTVVFRRADAPSQELLRMDVAYGTAPVMTGDGSWLSASFTPFSERLGRAVSYREDAEEWARSLPAAYAGSGMLCEVTHDDRAHSRIFAPAADPAPAIAPTPVTPELIAEAEVIAAASAVVEDPAPRVRAARTRRHYPPTGADAEQRAAARGRAPG